MNVLGRWRALIAWRAQIAPRALIALAVLATVTGGCGAEFRVSEEQYVRPEATVVTLPSPTPLPQQVGTFVDQDNGLNGPALISPANSDQQYLVAEDGTPIFTWLGTGTARSAQLLPDGSLLRSVDASQIDAPSATGALQLVGDGETLWSCVLNQSWHGGRHLRGEALWIPPSEERGTMPWGSIMASVYDTFSERQVDAAGVSTPRSFESVWVDGLIEIVPNLDEDGRPTGGGGFGDGDCGEVIWEWSALDRISRDATGVRIPRGGDWTESSQFVYSPDDDMVAIAMTGIGEVWVIDHSVSTQASASDAEAATLLARWQDMRAPTGVAWLSGKLYIAGDGHVTRMPLGADDKTEPFFTYEGRGRGLLDGLGNNHLLLVDADRGRLVEIDRNGTVYWDFTSQVVNAGDGEDDEFLAPNERVPRGANRLLSAHVYPPDFSGIPAKALENADR